ncbi:MAG: hypothetical protein O3A14_13515 [Cyanobacteria bacterium]|nr:hypothetical protein [Cyanobacteriota bacterium]
MIAIPSRNGYCPDAPPWRTATVQTFFAQMPWEGAPQRKPLGLHDAGSLAPTPILQQTVAAFFQCCPWEGRPEIAVPVMPRSVQPPPAKTAEALTLDDFSSLF